MKRFSNRYPVATSLCILLICVAGLFINGCSKKDQNEKQTTNITPPAASAFFTVPSSTDPLVAAVAASLQRQDVKGNIESQLSSHAGVPKWDKAMISLSTVANAGKGETGVADPVKFILIPFVLEEKKQTNAMLKVKISSADTSYELIYAGQYAEFGFEKKEKGKWNALNLFHLFTRFDNAIFGHKKFLVKDKRILAGLGAHEQETTTVELIGDKTLAAKLVMVPICTDYDICLKPCKAFKTATANRLGVCCIEWGTSSICTLVWVDDGTPTPVGGPSPVPGGNPTPIGGTPGTPTPIIDPCKTDPTISRLDPRCLELDAGWQPIMDQNFAVEREDGLTDTDPNIQWWDANVSDPNTNYFAQVKPSFANMNANYPKNSAGTDDMPAVDVCKLIGGEVLTNYYKGNANNACALRVSRALNYSGITIPKISGHTWQGADGKNYFYYAEHLFNWMTKTFQAADIHLTAADGAPNGTNFKSKLVGVQNRGIYIMRPKSRASFSASGHATLWGGLDCVGNHNFFSAASDIYIWKLN